MDAGGLPVDVGACAESPSLGDPLGSYRVEWRCHSEVSDDFPDLSQQCGENENPLAAATQVTIDGDSVLSLTFDGSSTWTATRTPDRALIADGFDGAQERIGGYVARCTSDSLVIGVGWRTRDDLATSYWLALAHR